MCIYIHISLSLYIYIYREMYCIICIAYYVLAMQHTCISGLPGSSGILSALLDIIVSPLVCASNVSKLFGIIV